MPLSSKNGRENLVTFLLSIFPISWIDTMDQYFWYDHMNISIVHLFNSIVLCLTGNWVLTSSLHCVNPLWKTFWAVSWGQSGVHISLYLLLHYISISVNVMHTKILIQRFLSKPFSPHYRKKSSPLTFVSNCGTICGTFLSVREYLREFHW